MHHHHIQALTNIVGPERAETDPSVLEPHLREWRDKFKGKTSLMVTPTTLDAVQQVLGYCNEHRIEVVTQGGNTGLVGGGIPGLEGRDQLLLSTRKLRSVLSVDGSDMSVTASAGYTVSEIQAAAADQGLMFPLSLASEGSCTVGGVVSTNAGGVHVLRYGTTRALTLGVEAVLPTGAIVNELSSLRKDNTGYSLSQLLIGAEGTLGVVTAATFKLYPPEHQKLTYWLGVPSPEHALRLLARAQRESGNRVSAFEFMPQLGLDMVLKHIPGTSSPLKSVSPWYVLMEIAASQPDATLSETMTSMIETALADGLIEDGAIASSMAQSQGFWRLRESMSEAQKHEGGSIKHDISVPVSKVPEFLEKAGHAVMASFPGARLTPFGHLGDGNIHFNVMQPTGTDKQTFLAQWEGMNTLVHDIVSQFGGSISAEHGIGTLKRSELARLKPSDEIEAMRQIKRALDPHAIMNPGVLFA